MRWPKKHIIYTRVNIVKSNCSSQKHNTVLQQQRGRRGVVQFDDEYVTYNGVFYYATNIQTMEIKVQEYQANKHETHSQNKKN